MSVIRKIATSVALSGTFLFAPLASAADAEHLSAQYNKLGTSIVDMVNSRSVNVGDVEKSVLELTKISVALSEEYKQVHPAGSKLLDLVASEVAVIQGGQVKSVGPMVKLSFKEIEDQWHDLGFTESQDVGIDMEDEDNEHFTDPLHVMIHPIMVLRAAQDFSQSKSDDDLNAMKSEMEEGMEQVDLLIGAIK